MPVWFRATGNKENYKVLNPSEKQCVRWATYFVQTIPPNALRDEARTLSFINPFRSHLSGIILLSERLSEQSLFSWLIKAEVSE